MLLRHLNSNDLSLNYYKKKGVKFVGGLLAHEKGHVKIANKHKPLIKAAVEAVNAGKSTNCDEDLAMGLAETFLWVNVTFAFNNAVSDHNKAQGQHDTNTGY